MLLEGVRIINYSISRPFDGPGDGTSPSSVSPLKTVDRAVAGGAIWVNSAGNYGQRTWFGAYSNSDGDSYIDFNGSDQGIDIQLEAGDEISVDLRWEDSWDGATSNLDLLVMDDVTRVILERSQDPQSGEVGHYPTEYLRFEAPSDGEYDVVVAHRSGSAPGWIQLIVKGDTPSIEHYTGTGSIANPAESSNPGMLAVGAAHWNSVGSIDPYSSRGPTPDGRVKPDIVGADCGATALRPLKQNQNGFCGTSQSAAHVAGMAALVRQRFPTYTAVEVADYLKEHAEQRESPDPNNTWGHGFAKLPSLSECSDAVPSAASNPGLVADCEALLAARDTLAGSGTLNWSGSTAIAAWDDVTLSGSPLRVTSLVLSDSQLTGTIPPELGNLNNLERLNLTRNQLTGDIPPELSLLTNLQLLALGGNQLTGPIPTWLVNITNLEELYLWGNQFTGAIPPELGNLPGLVKLGLSRNQLTGGIPPQLSSLTNLRYFSLSDNQLSGPVPTWMGSLADLQELYLSQNQLSGAIPSELGSLVNLQELHLSQNQLTGPIPAELGSLVNLRELWLNDNQLSGPVPTWMGSLADLEELYLSQNQLSGEIPTELGSLTNLERLHISRNQLTGQIPSQLASLTNLQRLSLYDNQLTGPIPASLGGLTNLERLSLSQNQLSGAIPTELGSLSKLQVLYISRNQLTGQIPSQLASLTNLQRLSLYDNQLTGPIPTELGSLSKLEELFLSGNQLTGCIPVGIADVVNNDFSELGLPFCGGAPGSPTIGTLTTGANFLTATWSAPVGSGGPAISAYDLRYIQTSADETVDANWTVVDDAWAAGSGALSHQISGLTGGTQYDVQVRAVTAAGDGPWSATAPGTPATWGAIRSFSPPSVAPAGEVVIMITASGYGRFGAVTETLPPGFSYVSSSLEDSGVTDVGREVRFSLFGQTAFTYTVTAPGTAGTYSFSGVLRNSDREDVPVGGALTIAVAAGDPLIVRYDANGNGTIEKNEVINAINDYLFGEGDEAISKSDVIKLINLYLFG